MSQTILQAEGSAATALLSLGVARPERVVTNDEICEVLDSSDEWIRTRSGIVSRRIAGPEQDLIALAAEAAANALAQSGISPDELGCVIVATSTNPRQTPPIAAQVAHRVGAQCGSFDLTAGCAGFCHGLAVAADMVRAGSAKYVLLVGAEKLSTFTDREDRRTAFIFGDGAGAAVIGPADTPGIGPVVWGSDGEQSEMIVSVPQADKADADHHPVIQMDGHAVFRWAPYAMADVCRDAVKAAGITTDDLAAFIPHQANLRITKRLAKNLDLPDGVAIADDITEAGNTSAASVPLAMEHMLRDGAARPGELALLVGFGAGLSYAAQVVALPPLR